MDEWNQLKEEVKALIEERKKVPMSSESQDGLMSHDNFSKLGTISLNATIDIVDYFLDNKSLNLVKTDAVKQAVSELELSIDDILSKKQQITQLYETIDQLLELESIHALLMTGVHKAANSDGNISIYVYPSRSPSDADFSFGTSAPSTGKIMMWCAQPYRPLFWINRDKTQYASEYGTQISWDDFTITTNPDEFKYSYNELNNVASSASTLIKSLSIDSLNDTKIELQTLIEIMGKYISMFEQFFNEFLIGYCTSTNCTSSNCSQFTEWKANLTNVNTRYELLKSRIS